MSIKEPITRELLMNLLIDSLTEMKGYDFIVVCNLLLDAYTIVNEEGDTFTISWYNVNRSE